MGRRLPPTPAPSGIAAAASAAVVIDHPQHFPRMRMPLLVLLPLLLFWLLIEEAEAWMKGERVLNHRRRARSAAVGRIYQQHPHVGAADDNVRAVRV